MNTNQTDAVAPYEIDTNFQVFNFDDVPIKPKRKSRAKLKAEEPVLVESVGPPVDNLTRIRELVAEVGAIKNSVTFGVFGADGVPAFFRYGDNKRGTWNQNQACHYSLQSYKGGVFVINRTSTKAPVTPEITERFLAWLIAPGSPWAAAFRNDLQTANDIVTQKAAIMDGRNCTGTVMAGACVSMRALYEYPSIVKTWDMLVNSGVNPSFAFWLSHVFRENERGGYYIKSAGDHHTCLSPISFSFDSMKNFLLGRPNYGEPYVKNSSYHMYPAFTREGDKSAAYYESFKNRNKGIIPDLGPSGGGWGDPTLKGFITFDKILEVGLAEYAWIKDNILNG